uniref:DSBA domain-containing protein n=1 Tax=Macrostomum lignano TaxID=282301 RepID=A0A1I8FD69_9PLAT
MLSDEVKSRLKSVTDEAVKLGAFGSPTFIVHTEDGRQEMVFGSDRFHIIGDLLAISAMSRRIDFYYDILSALLLSGLRGSLPASFSMEFNVQLKADYMLGRDLPRLSKHYRVPLVMNDKVVERMFKIGTDVNYAVSNRYCKSDNLMLLRRLAVSCSNRLFSSHQDVAQPDSLRAAAEAAGLSADVTAAALTDMLSDEVKSRLKTVTDEAVKLGAFGSPTFIVPHRGRRRQEMVFAV